MGDSKLTYQSYLDNFAYWHDIRGLDAPLWAQELYDCGFEPVSAIDFYDDVFCDDLEPHRLPEDYKSGEYGGIAVEMVPTGDDKFKGRRTTVTQGNYELYDLIDRSENFCMIAPVSYAGLQRTNQNARYLYALVIEIDDIEKEHGITELLHSWNRENQRLPRATFCTCSGSGLHLTFVFQRPVPLFGYIFEQLSAAKTYLTKRFWNKYVTNSHQNIQYESVNQPFRCPGTVTKDGKAYAMAFRTGEKITIEELNLLLPEELKINEVYKSTLSLEEAKEKYPAWYQRRIVEGKERGHYNRHEGIYYNWIEKVRTGAVVGHRYNCLENLCSLAVQCRIDPRQVEQDCRELASFLEELTVAEDNHFTEYDIICALKTYHKGNEGAYRRKIEYISQKTGIELTRAKRNGQPRAWHLQDIRSKKANMKGRAQKFKRPEGRPSAQRTVELWQAQNPGGRKADCIRDTGLSKPTVYKWWVGKAENV